MAALSIVAMGLAMPLPAMSGAEPPLGSYRPNFVSFKLALANIPMEPVTILASSDRMSPNMFSVSITSEADAVEAAVKQVLAEGYRTIDIMPQKGENPVGNITQVGTAQMGDLIAERV